MLSRSRHDRPRTIAALDIGTSKVCCVVAAIDPAAQDMSGRPRVQILGFGYQPSRGVKAGTVVDLAAAEEPVRGAVGAAERMAGRTVDQVYLSVSCGRLGSEQFTARAEIAGRAVAGGDVARLFVGGRAFAERGHRSLVRLAPDGYVLDRRVRVQEPLGMECRELAAEFVAVTADAPALRNLSILVERCHLSPAGLLPAPFASALAVLTPEERRLGCITIDIGGGTSLIASLKDDRLRHVDGVALGGKLITDDIARELSLRVADAERIKTVCGTLMAAASDVHEYVDLGQSDAAMPGQGSEFSPGHGRVSRAQLRHLIERRIDLLAALLTERLDRIGAAEAVGRRFVVTGGASMLVGMAEVLAQRLHGSVRVGRPIALPRVPEALDSPIFATVLGTIEAVRSLELQGGLDEKAPPEEAGLLGRLKSWARESF